MLLSNFKRLSIHDLEILSELPKMTSIRSFAQTLDITPSFLSKKIQKIESALEMKLIHRTTRGVNVTKDAENSILVAREILEKISEIKTPTDKNIHRSIPILTIGTRGFLNTALSGSLIEHFIKIDFKYNFRFVDMSPTDQMDSALNDSVDIILGLKKINFGENWYSEKIGDLTWSIFAKKGHPLTMSSAVDIEQALVYPFTKPTYWDGTSIITINDSIPLSGQKIIYGHGVQNTETAISVVTSSKHLTYLPKVSARKALERGDVSEVIIKSIPPKKDALYLSVHSDRVTATFLRELKQVLKEFL